MLNFRADVQMAGKLPQLGSRLVDPLRTNSWPNFFRASSKQ